MLDLDHFKGVNDTLGHDVGDLLLKAAAERLRAALRKGDTVARFGGDEFVLILPDLEVIEDAIQVVQKIVDSFRKPFLIDTHQLVVTTSIGIAIFPSDGADGAALLRNAAKAMRRAQTAGGNTWQFFHEGFDPATSERLGLESALHRALELEPPRFCTVCQRRMVVQIVPTGWTARCSEHGDLHGGNAR